MRQKKPTKLPKKKDQKNNLNVTKLFVREKYYNCKMTINPYKSIKPTQATFGVIAKKLCF